MRLAWTLDDLLTADSDTARMHFSATAWPLNTPADRKLFVEVFGRISFDSDPQAVRRHFESALTAAARQAISVRDVAYWLSDAGRSDMTATLKKAADAVAFNCGISIGHPMEIEIDSPTYRRRQLDSAQRQWAEESAAGRLEHAERTLALLGRFESLRQSSPQLNPAQILQQLAPLDQGKTLQALLMADASRTAANLWIASGSQLLKLLLPSAQLLPDNASLATGGQDLMSDPKSETKPLASSAPETVFTSPTPIRSVRPAEISGRQTLLLGSQNSVIRLDPASTAQSICYCDDDTPRQMGFNSTVLLDNTLWAAHGQAGLVAWNVDRPESPLNALRPDVLQKQANASSDRPGHLLKLDDQRALFAVGPSLLLLTADGKITPLHPPRGDDDSSIVAILDEHQTIAILHASGQLLRLHCPGLEIAARQRPTASTTAAAPLPWMGTVRLLLATAEGPIRCLSRDDPLVTQYLSPYRALAILNATAGCIAAVTSDRQRLIIWNSWDSSSPVADYSITSLTRHRIADMAFAK
jgi:hypothetical protein